MDGAPGGLRYTAAMRQFAIALLMAVSVCAVAQQPCTKATAECEAWVKLGPTSRAMVYSSYSLTTPNANLRRALVMVHGTGRNADHYFETATGAAFFAGALGDTVVIAPALHSNDGSCKDKLEPNEVSWSCGGDSWRSGGVAASGDTLNGKNLTSFDFVDEILRKLADKKVFPNLQMIVVAGHSAGGQFVARYAMANRVEDGLGVAVSYVVANPSSYAWPDAMRVLPVNDGAPANAGMEWKDDKIHTNYSFGPFADAAKVPKYDQWPFGLEGRKTGYTVGMSDEQLKKQLVARKVTYLFGQVDVLPLGGFDDSAPAMAQGATRRARGEAYVKYIHDTLGATSQAMIVPECGHNDRCIYTTNEVWPLIFPKW